MGEETIRIASRFSNAVNELVLLGRGDLPAQRGGAHGADLAATIRAALDAVEAVYGSGTDAVRDWSAQRRRVLAQVARMRQALERSGVDGEVRRMARALVDVIGPGPRGR